MKKTPARSARPSLTGLTRGSRIRPQVLGRRGSRLVVDATHTRLVLDPGSELVLFPLRDVFTRPSVVLGFGNPNTYLTLPSEEGWEKYSGFMFWRSPSSVVKTKGRVQSGVLYELPDLSQEAVERIRDAAQRWTGKRTVSCAWACAQVLTEAGFTAGGRSLKRVARPSKLAARIWEDGLELDGEPVTLRVLHTKETPSDHFVSVWNKELASLGRLARKLLKKEAHTPAPTFPELEAAEAQSSDGPTTTIGVARPSTLGAHLGFLLGEQPIFSAELPEVVQTSMRENGLDQALLAYPGKLSKMTWLKCHVLFSKPVIAFMRAHLASQVETYEDVPAATIPQMLRNSSRDRGSAFVYNYVVTGTEFRLKRLENQNGRDQKIVNWLLAKHVLVSGYDPDVRLAGECWSYLDPEGNQRIVISGNSGTYKPPMELVPVAAALISEVFGLPVEVDDDVEIELLAA